MKKLLAVLAVATLSGTVANAQDKGTEFKFGGELRQRYGLTQNGTFVANGAHSEQRFEQRNQFHINAVSSDKLQAYFNLIHTALWGSNVNVTTNPNSAATLGAHNTTGLTGLNGVQMSEAWLWWKVSDMVSLKAGRSTAAYGAGLVLSKGDWGGSPNVFDGALARFSWDFLDLDFAGAKLVETGIATPILPATSVAAVSNTTDAEVNAWVLHASFKNLPDVLKAADVFVIQVNGDAIGAAPAANGGSFAPGISNTAGTSTHTPNGAYNLTTYGAHVKGDVAIIDYRLDLAMQSGKQKTQTAGAADMSYGGSMYDLEVGANFPEFMKGRLYAGYHMDSGDDVTATGSGDKNEEYQPLFADTYGRVGRANIFGFGNLTNIRLGLTVAPDENCVAGIEANLLSRTSDKSGPTVQGLQGTSFNTNAAAVSARTNTDKALGTEIDLWMKHNYGHGFSMLGQFSYVMLGNYFTPGAPTAAATYAASVGKNAWQLLAQAQYNF